MKWSRREVRFLGWLLLGTVCWVVMFFVVMLPIMLFLEKSHLPERLQTHFICVCAPLAMVPYTYVIARYSILLPATAVDQRRDLGWAWNTTQDNGWRLFLVVFFLPSVLNFPLNLLRGHGLFLNFAGSAVSCILYVVGVTALSLSYQYLVSRPTQRVAKPRTLGSALMSKNDVTAGDRSTIQ